MAALELAIERAIEETKQLEGNPLDGKQVLNQ